MERKECRAAPQFEDDCQLEDHRRGKLFGKEQQFREAGILFFTNDYCLDRRLLILRTERGMSSTAVLPKPKMKPLRWAFPK
jgi:hypothetical protein